MNDALVISNASVRRGARSAVINVSFAVGRGIWFGMAGVNGSGKTSLLRAISGRLPFHNGVCAMFGEDLSTDRKARAIVCGFNPPSDKLPDRMKFDELLDITAGDYAHGRAAIGPLWDTLGLEALRDRWVGEMSSGMRQRISLALAFARNSDIVVLDEPFNWLDPVAAFDLKTSIRDRVKAGLTVVTAIHDISTLCSFCDQGALMLPQGSLINIPDSDLKNGRRDPFNFEEQMVEKLRLSHSSIK